MLISRGWYLGKAVEEECNAWVAAIGKEMDKVDAERTAAIRDDLASRDRGMRISCNTLEDLKGVLAIIARCARDTCRWS